MLEALGVDAPVIEIGEPLAPGFGAAAKITGGFLTYRNTSPRVDELEARHSRLRPAGFDATMQAKFTQSSGFVRRLSSCTTSMFNWVSIASMFGRKRVAFQSTHPGLPTSHM